MTGYVRQSVADIVTSAVVQAAPLNAEFDQLQSAFSAASGHKHDGSAGEGPQISLGSGVTGTLTLQYGGTGGSLSSAPLSSTIVKAASSLTYIKNNLSGAAAPTTTDDSSSGYGFGSLWWDSVNSALYQCVNPSAAAAQWSIVSGTSGNIFPATSNLSMGGFVFTSHGKGTARTHSPNLGQLQDNDYRYVTAGGTDNYSATLTPAITSYVAGMEIVATFNTANTTTVPTLAVNGLAAKDIVRADGTALAASDIAASSLHRLAYDGTKFRANIAPAASTLALINGGRKTASFTADSNTRYQVAWASSGVITLPASPSQGDVVNPAIFYSTFATSINPNGKKINGSTGVLTLGVINESLFLTYDATLGDWT